MSSNSSAVYWAECKKNLGKLRDYNEKVKMATINVIMIKKHNGIKVFEENNSARGAELRSLCLPVITMIDFTSNHNPNFDATTLFGLFNGNRV
jgi:hypothetical protein